jgi:protein arginine kinase activator
MKCDLCGEKATVFYTQVANGKMKKTALCESCADHQGVTDPNGLLMADQLMGMPLAQETQEVTKSLDFLKEGTAVECPSCRFSLEDYRKVGRLGCGDCYLAFGVEIEQRLPSLHKGLEHSGRAPAGLLELELKRSLIDRLNNNLEKAIAIEDYEAAATIRDELQFATKDLSEEESKP